MNVEHGEENVQVKAHAYVHRWEDQIQWRILVWLEYF